ncbi:MAG: outer membrane beta-barrel protein [Rickettsiales bacterium]|nr:outer membrane beta-barrel protein [Rickettsiales bacterium]
MDLNVQYHFAPYGKLTPYVGAGVTYAVFLGDYAENTFGYNAQVGLDYWGSKNTSISFGIKRYFGLETTTSLDFTEVGATYENDIEVNPTYFTFGVGYRF